MRLKIPPGYILLIILVLVVIVFILSIWTGILDIQDVYVLIATSLILWGGIIFVAIMGGVFIGMLLGHRLLSSANLTPFEEEMLRMKEDVTEIKDMLREMKQEEQK